MDGNYNRRASINRANLARLARGAGVDTKILGFSWSGSADPAAQKALKAASMAGTKLLLRDPISAERARADGLLNVVESADTVFSAREVDYAAARSFLAVLPGETRIALVNASGLIAKSLPQVDEYRSIIRHLQQRGLTVILLPHVSRAGSNDIEICRQIQSSLDDPDVFFVDRLLKPAEIRALTEHASIVVTGRMHLAIMSLSNKVPAITLVTQGKVEGLMTLFASECLCVEPAAGFGSRVVEVADDVLDHIDEFKERIAARLPLVKELSRRNFE